MYAVAILCSFKNYALVLSVMPFQYGVVFQTLIVAASLLVAKSSLTHPTYRTTRSIERYSDGAKSLC